MKHHLHRSITFWSGLLVMAFICWAWRDSQTNEGRIFAGRWMTTHQSSAVTIWNSPDLPPDWQIDYRLGDNSFFDTKWLPQPFMLTGRSAPPDDGSYDPFASDSTYRDALIYQIATGNPDAWMAFIPHWLILVTVALLWSALLLWRARRRKRAVA